MRVAYTTSSVHSTTPSGPVRPVMSPHPFFTPLTVDRVRHVMARASTTPLAVVTSVHCPELVAAFAALDAAWAEHDRALLDDGEYTADSSSDASGAESAGADPVDFAADATQRILTAQRRCDAAITTARERLGGY
jgi:hypothetical protein